MNKKAFLILVSAIALTSGIVGYNNIQKEYETMDELTLANIEALTNYEGKLGRVEAQCVGPSVVKCIVVCKKCYVDYSADYARGWAQKARGECQECGHTEFMLQQ